MASGRRVTSLENLLEFVTGASEEPTLGFDQQPGIELVLAVVTEAKIGEVSTNLFKLIIEN